MEGGVVAAKSPGTHAVKCERRSRLGKEGVGGIWKCGAERRMCHVLRLCVSIRRDSLPSARQGGFDEEIGTEVLSLRSEEGS